MTSINIKNLKEIAQKQIKDLTDNSSVTDLENLMKIAMLSGGGHLEVDSDGLLPSSGRVAFDKQYDRIFINKSPSGADWEELKDDGTYTAASAAVPSQIQGSNFGYSLGGRQSSFYNYVERYSYTSDGNSIDTANLTAGLAYHQSSYSATDAFTHRGYTTEQVASVDKFNFASATDATDFGDFPSTGQHGGGNSSPTHGYQGGGEAGAVFSSTEILKFPHSAGSVSTSDVGDLTEGSQYNDTNSSATHGYHHAIAGSGNKIEKYSFSADGNATDVGDLLDTTGDGRGTNAGLMSDVSGGFGYVNLRTPSIYNISRYSFVSDGNATDHTDLNTNSWLGGVSSSTTSGYLAGGLNPAASGYINVIQKFPYASTTNGTDVGDLIGQIGYNGAAAN